MLFRSGDPRWNCGYLDRWEENRKQPWLPGVSGALDPCQLLAQWFAGCDRLVVVAEHPDDQKRQAPCAVQGSRVPQKSLAQERSDASCGALLTDLDYVRGLDAGFDALAVLIGHESACLNELAAKYHAAAHERRPLLVHPYLPGRPALDLTAVGLPRPVPILPLLIRTGRYVHRPGAADPDPRTLLRALAAALGKRTTERQT